MIPRMRAHRAVPLVGVMLALSPTVCASRAQSVSGRDTPAAVVDSFFSATGQERWRDAARLMDLEAFAGLRDETVRNMRRPPSVYQVTPEELMKRDPKMPRVVAEYQAARANEPVGRYDLISYEYAGVSGPDSLAALPVQDAAARWLQAKDPRYQMRRSLEAERIRCNLPDSVISELVRTQMTKTRVLGTVTADSMAYVLYTDEPVVEAPDARPDTVRRRTSRRRAASRAFWVMPPPVLTLRRVGTHWRIAPGEPFGGMSGFASFINCAGTGAGDSSSVHFR